MSPTPPTEETTTRQVGPVPEGKPATDGLGNPIRYDTEGHIFPESPVDQAIYAVETIEEAVTELAWLSVVLFAATADRMAEEGSGTGSDVLTQAMCALVGRLIAPEAGGLAPVVGAIDVTAHRETAVTVREAVKAHVIEQHHKAHHVDQPAPGVGAYL